MQLYFNNLGEIAKYKSSEWWNRRKVFHKRTLRACRGRQNTVGVRSCPLGWVHIEVYGIRYTVFSIRYSLFAIRYTGMAGHIKVARVSYFNIQNGYFRRRRFGSSPTGRGWGGTYEEKKNGMGTTTLPNATCVGGVPHNISKPDRSPWWEGVF